MKIKEHIIASGDEEALGVARHPFPEPHGPPEYEDGTLLRATEVERLTTLDRKTIARLIAAESFPRPVQLSERRMAWKRGDVRKWLSNPEGWVSF